MRDITFRGKSVNNGEWVYGYLIGRANDTGRACEGNSSSIMGNRSIRLWRSFQKQSDSISVWLTGTGEDLRGDILSVESSTHRYSVEFDVVDLSFIIRDCADRRFTTNIAVYDQNELHRCGTIYDQEESA